MSLTTIDFTPRIGTEIRIDVDSLVSGKFAVEIRRLLEERGVLVFRDLYLDKAQQEAFSGTIGNLQVREGSGIHDITFNPGAAAAAYLKGSFFWHIDGASEDVPNLAAVLNAKKLSESGGDTLFANTYAAFDDLSDADKAFYETLRVVHSIECSQRYVTPQPSSAELAMWQARPPKIHPLVWTHLSGRKSLVLGCTADYVENMDIPDGRALLCKLREWATQPQYVYRHLWKPGDLLVWDNTGTMHMAEPYPLESGRLMHRCTINGEEAIA